MKKIFILVILFNILSYSKDLSLEQIKNMVNKIHERREGIKLSTLESTKEPFVRSQIDENNISTFVIPRKEKEIAVTNEKIVLHSILNNRAYINDQWYDLNDTLFGYKLKFIGKIGVVLRNSKDIKKLYLHKKKHNLIKLEETK